MSNPKTDSTSSGVIPKAIIPETHIPTKIVPHPAQSGVLRIKKHIIEGISIGKPTNVPTSIIKSNKPNSRKEVKNKPVKITIIPNRAVNN